MRSIIYLLVISLLIGGQAWAGEPTHPVIKSVRVTPFQFNAATGLTVEPVLVNDDEYFSFEYRWFLNGEEVLAETTASFPGQLLKRDDEVAVEVTPVDADGGRRVPLLGLPLKAVNVSPVIHSLPPTNFGDGTYVYQVQASDLDGDTLSYHLENAPESITLDASMGMLRWSIADLPEGEYSTMIVVEDGHGGRAEQVLGMMISHNEKGAPVNE